MRLLIDEVCPPALAEAVRAAGFESRRVSETGSRGTSGAEVLAAMGRGELADRVVYLERSEAVPSRAPPRRSRLNF